jgi:hypothetical protein
MTVNKRGCASYMGPETQGQPVCFTHAQFVTVNAFRLSTEIPE